MRPLRALSLSSLVLAASLSWGCEPEPDTRDACVEASEHIAVCQGTEPTPLLACDESIAADVLASPCADLAADSKSDAVSSLLCNVGLLRHCEVPACDDGLADDHDFTGMDCADLIDLGGCAACDYYRCREAQSAGQCGDDGYYLGFGYRYCLRYRQVTEPLMSPRGQAWSARTRQCLMQTLEHEVSDDVTDCDEIRDAAYASHPPCYVDAGFCDIGLVDRGLLVSTIDHADKDFTVMKDVALHCVGD